MKRYFSFTLVELLAVTALVALLGAIGFAGYGYAMNASRRAATESLIQQISAGLENFKIKNGYYPVSKGYEPITFFQNGDYITAIGWGKKSDGKYETSWGNSSDTQPGVTVKAFLKPFDQEKLKKNISGGNLVDSWGGAIYYRYPGKFNKTGFDLIAPGEDGVFGTNNQSGAKLDEAEFKDGADWACDDISNFMDK